MGPGLMPSSMRLAVGLVAALVAGTWLGVAFELFLWDHPEERWLTAGAARGAASFAVAFAVCEVARRLLRAGWFFLVPVTALVGAVLYDGVTLAWDGSAAWLVARIVAYWIVSLPVMAAVVVLGHVATKRKQTGAGV
jgi:hypothetical protein